MSILLEDAATFDTGFKRNQFAKKEMSLNANCVQTHSGGRGWIRTTEAEKQQIYSLPPLATRELAHNGAGDGTRTRNLLITNQLLCQLSYTSDESSPNVESFSTLTDYTI